MSVGKLCFLSLRFEFLQRLDRNENQPAHDKTYDKNCVASKDSDQPVNLHNMARFLVYPFLDTCSLEAV